MGDGGLWQRSSAELLREIAEVETHIRRSYAASLELIAELASRDVVAEVGYPNLAMLLRDVLRISSREAHRRLSHVAAVADAPVVSGGVVSASLPVAGVAMQDGVLDADHLDVIAKALRDAPLHVPDADLAFAEQTLVDAARELDAGRLAKVGHRVREWLHEDDTPPDDSELAQPVNELHLSTRPNGRTAFRGELDPESSALLLTVISPLAKPRPNSHTGPDPRSAAERQGDALMELLRLAADTGALPSEGGEKPHLLVTVPLDMLRDGLSHTLFNTGGISSHAVLDGNCGNCGHAFLGSDTGDHAVLDGVGDTGSRAVLGGRRDHAVLDGVGRLDAASARRLACDATVIPAVLGSRSEPLDLGRASYTVSTALRRALVLRDNGCTFPGCDRSHRWCHAHHIRHWADGGATTSDNLVLLCGQHHRLVHHSDWECTVTRGRPEFRPPAFIDPHRTPRHNTHHHTIRC